MGLDRQSLPLWTEFTTKGKRKGGGCVGQAPTHPQGCRGTGPRELIFKIRVFGLVVLAGGFL